MKLEIKTFSSKISRRIFLSFLTCALLPALCFAIIVYFQVTSHLKNQNLKNLHHAVKFHAKNIIDRLNDLENQLKWIGSIIEKSSNHTRPAIDDGLRSRLSKQFQSITLFLNSKQFYPVLNQFAVKSFKLQSEDIKHLSAGSSLLAEIKITNSRPGIIMIRRVDIDQHEQAYVIGEINLKNFWELDDIDNLPLDTAYCALGPSHRLLHCSEPDLEEISNVLKGYTQLSTAGNFEFRTDAKNYIASFSDIFLKPNYKLPGLTIILLKTKSDVFASIASFRIIFPLLVVLTLMVILLFSISIIRKNLVPINELKKGAKRISQNDFSQKVEVSSCDEFEELSISFNQMSENIENKFKTLTAKADIDRAILSNSNSKELIKACLKSVNDCIACNMCGISLIDLTSSFEGRSLYCFALEPKNLMEETFKVSPHDIKGVERNPDYFFILPNHPMPNYLPVRRLQQRASLHLFPIWVRARLKAVLWVQTANSAKFADQDISLSRQLADQIAVGLTNTDLIEKLKELNWGTLQALARTVDAKSSWTAGHSNRVAEMVLKLGDALNFPSDELDNLHRAALLHDIGKVGIPSAILNKHTKLNEKEFCLIKQHPALGAKILEPIIAFKEIIPIVAQHHERFDGLGYPSQLAGEDIHIGARILSLADVYDAILSDRPYRRALTPAEVLDIIKKEAGRQFDPVLVEAMLSVIEDERQKAA